MTSDAELAQTASPRLSQGFDAFKQALDFLLHFKLFIEVVRLLDVPGEA